MGVLIAPGGRAIVHEAWGAADGAPVLLLHGAPGSRLFVPDADVTAGAGVRLLTFDRPGYGGSDPWPGRAVGDVAADVERLADHLALERFAIVGWSGGGPSAVAAAHRLGDRVTALAIVSAPGPLDEVPGAWEALGEYRRPTAEMARREPHRSARAIGRHMQPFLAEPSSFLGRGRGADGLVLGDAVSRAMLDAQLREALRQGTVGLADDLIAMWLDWGFRLADLRVPTTVWHGDEDRHNEADAVAYAARIPGATLHRWPDAGHLGIVAKWAEVLAAVSPGREPDAASG